MASCNKNNLLNLFLFEIILKQEAMENFVFPDEIDKTKLMKMNDEHFFMFPKIMQKCSKLYAFSLIIDLKTSGNTLFIAIPQLLGDFDQTGNHMQTIPSNPPFRQGVICHI